MLFSYYMKIKLFLMHVFKEYLENIELNMLLLGNVFNWVKWWRCCYPLSYEIKSFEAWFGFVMNNSCSHKSSSREEFVCEKVFFLITNWNILSTIHTHERYSEDLFSVPFQFTFIFQLSNHPLRFYSTYLDSKSLHRSDGL